MSPSCWCFYLTCTCKELILYINKLFNNHSSRGNRYLKVIYLKESSFVFISCVATTDKQQSPIHIANFFHSGLISSNCILARLIYSVGFNSSLQVTNPQHIITTS